MKICLSEFTYNAFEDLLNENFKNDEFILIDSEANIIHGEGKPDVALVSYELMFKALKSEDFFKTEKLIRKNYNIKFRNLVFDKNVSKLSIIGVGMITTPGVTFRMFQALAKRKINILVISTSEIKISVLINKKNIKKAIEALHKEFNLGK